MTTDIELKKSEKELCSQATQYTATSVDSNRYALSIHHKSSKVPCETVVLGPYNQANRMFRYQSRDSQCTINALCSLIFARFLHKETRRCLGKELFEGDILYNKDIADLKSQGLY